MLLHCYTGLRNFLSHAVVPTSTPPAPVLWVLMHESEDGLKYNLSLIACL